MIILYIIYIHIHIYTHTYKTTHTYIHTYIHTHTQRHTYILPDIIIVFQSILHFKKILCMHLTMNMSLKVLHEEDLIGNFFDDQIEIQDVKWLNDFTSDKAKLCVNPLASNVLVNIISHQKDNGIICVESFSRLTNIGGKTDTSSAWFNDEILDILGIIIMNEHKKYRDAGRQRTKFFIMRTLFSTRFKNDGYKVTEGSSKWNKKLDVDQEELIFVPYNTGECHWTLIIIDSRSSPAISIDYLDHLYPESSDRDKVMTFVQNWHMSRTKKTDLIYKLGEKDIYFYASIPHQQDSISCGLFVIIGILTISQRAEWPLQSKLAAENLIMMRRKLAFRILKKSWDADTSSASLVPQLIDLSDNDTSNTADVAAGNITIAAAVATSSASLVPQLIDLSDNDTSITADVAAGNITIAAAVATSASTITTAAATANLNLPLGFPADISTAATSATADAGGSTNKIDAAGTAISEPPIGFPADTSTAAATAGGTNKIDAAGTAISEPPLVFPADTSTAATSATAGIITITGGTNKIDAAGIITIAASTADTAAGTGRLNPRLGLPADTLVAATAATTSLEPALLGLTCTTTSTKLTTAKRFIVRPMLGWSITHTGYAKAAIFDLIWKELGDDVMSEFLNIIKAIVENDFKLNGEEWKIPLKNSDFVETNNCWEILDFLTTQTSITDFKYFKSLISKITEKTYRTYSGVLYNMLNEVFSEEIWTVVNNDHATYDYTALADTLKKV
jgi:hypothetical protein